METFLSVYGTIAIVIIAPIVQWIGRKIPGDYPIGSLALNLLLNIIFAWIINKVLSLALTTDQLWPIISAGCIASSAVHSIGKTAEKNGVNTMGLFAPKAKGDHSS